MPTAPTAPPKPPTGQQKPADADKPATPNADKPAESKAESKADRFRRIAGKRTAEALTAIEKIGHTSRSATYEYTDEQVDKIVTALREKVDGVEAALKNGGESAGTFAL